MRRSVALVSSSRDFLSALFPAMRAVFADVVDFPRIDAADAVADIVFVDADSIQNRDLHSIDQYAAKTKLVLVSDKNPDETIGLIGATKHINHVCNTFSIRESASLGAYVSRFFGDLREDHSVYVGDSARIRRCHITSYGEAPAVVRDVKSIALATGAFSEIGNIAATIASELIMNACFDAPVDRSTGVAKYAHMSRSENIVLNSAEVVDVDYGADASSFYIMVRDRFGALTRDDVIENLRRCAERGDNQVRYDAAGAGVGLYMLFRYATQLDFYLERGRRTAVVALISLGKRLVDYEARGPGINFFIKKS